MSTVSRVPISSQTKIHEDLWRQFSRHCQFPFVKLIRDDNRKAYEAALAAWRSFSPSAPLILDSGCGVGWSTLYLAKQNPTHFVLGVDQSADRLNRGKPGEVPANVYFVRADLVDFWRLLAADGVMLSQHALWYPNPWPKKKHLQRRWHGHPVFPVLRTLGGVLECRSNWRIYIEEMALALSWLSKQKVVPETFLPKEVATPFEKKYLVSGHVLWRCQCRMAQAA